jgi:hypothetical protein
MLIQIGTLKWIILTPYKLAEKMMCLQVEQHGFDAFFCDLGFSIVK